MIPAFKDFILKDNVKYMTKIDEEIHNYIQKQDLNIERYVSENNLKSREVISLFLNYF